MFSPITLIESYFVSMFSPITSKIMICASWPDRQLLNGYAAILLYFMSKKKLSITIALLLATLGKSNT